MAVAQARKYATSESGDTVEMIERPTGGLSGVLAGGQTSGKAAKAVAGIVVRKAISLFGDGVRDGPADYLYTQRSGKVLATLNTLSIDLHSQSLLTTRNNPTPVFVLQDGDPHIFDGPVDPVGGRRAVRPEAHQVPLRPGLAAVLFTDGPVRAGERSGCPIDLPLRIRELALAVAPDPRAGRTACWGRPWPWRTAARATTSRCSWLPSSIGRENEPAASLCACPSENESGGPRERSRFYTPS